MKKLLFIVVSLIAFCGFNCGNADSPSGLEGVDVDMNNGSTNNGNNNNNNNVNKMIVGSWECIEYNMNDGSGWMDISSLGFDFEISFYTDGTAEGIYFDDDFSTTWTSSGNTVTMSLYGTPATITNITSTTFVMSIQESGQRIDFRFVKL